MTLHRLGLSGVVFEIAERGLAAPLDAEKTTQLDLLVARQDELERAQRHIELEYAGRRQDPSTETQREALEVLRIYYRDNCPCPRLPAHLIRKGHWDHYRGRNDRRPESVWRIDEDCHVRRPHEPSEAWDAAFRRFQRYRTELRGRRGQQGLEIPATEQPEVGQLAIFEHRIMCGRCRRYTPSDDPMCHFCGEKSDA